MGALTKFLRLRHLTRAVKFVESWSLVELPRKHPQSKSLPHSTWNHIKLK